MSHFCLRSNGDSGCVDLQTDNTNCGACGVACTGGEQCVSSVCNCDVLLQNCADPADACFLNAVNNVEICALESFTATQGDACVFANGCAAGYGCLLSSETGLQCAFYCDADSLGGPTCDDGPGPGFDCIRLNDHFNNVNVRDVIGLCVPTP